MSGQLVEQWPFKPLGELCEFRNGLWKGKKPPYIEVGVIRNTNFTKNGSLDDSDIAYLDVEEKQFAKRQLEYGDIILEKSGGGPKQPVGRVIIFDKKEGLYSFSNFTSVIRIIDSSILDFRYLHYVLYWYYISGVTEGMQRRSTGIRNLDFNAYKSLKIPLPSIAEQKQIVRIIEDAFSQVNAAQQCTTTNLKDAKELFSSSLHNTFTISKPNWFESTIHELAEHRLGKMLDKKKNTGTFRPYLRNKNVRWFGFDLSDVNEMKFEDNERPKYTAVSGDLLICEGGYPGRAAIWNDTEPIYFQKALHRVRFHDKIHSKWFLYYLYYLDLTGGLRRHFTGTGIQHLTGKSLAKMSIPIAPSSEIVSQIMRLEKLHSEVKKLSQLSNEKMAELTKLKQSILRKAFSGTLRIAEGLADQS